MGDFRGNCEISAATLGIVRAASGADTGTGASAGGMDGAYAFSASVYTERRSAFTPCEARYTERASAFTSCEASGPTAIITAPISFFISPLLCRSGILPACSCASHSKVPILIPALSSSNNRQNDQHHPEEGCLSCVHCDAPIAVLNKHSFHQPTYSLCFPHPTAVLCGKGLHWLILFAPTPWWSGRHQ